MSAEAKAAGEGNLEMVVIPKHHVHFVGTDVRTGAPIVKHISSFMELCLKVGPMGSGKSTAMEQLAVRDTELGYSVVYIDLKGGSLEVHEGLRLAAQRRGVPMKRFSIAMDYASHVANPFLMRFWETMSARQRAQYILAIGGVENDLAKYGEGFFTTACGELAAYLFENCEPIRDFVDCANRLEHIFQVKPVTIPGELLRHGAHIVGAARRLSGIEALNAGSANESDAVFANRIDFADLFQTQQVHYYHLPASRGGQLAGEVSRAICRGVTSAAEALRNRGQTFFFIDEFGEASSSMLNTFLSQSRSLNIGVTLSNQSIDQISDKTVLANVVNGTRIRQWFGFGPDTQLWFEARSGKRIDHLRSITKSDKPFEGSTSITLSETLVPYLSVNDLKRITADPTLSVLESVRDDGLTHTGGLPQVVRTRYTISETEYHRRQNAEWPVDPGTVLQRQPVDDIHLNERPPTPRLA